MKIALLADVHANFFALQAVVKDALAKGAEEFWNLGDDTGYNPFPNESIALLRRFKAKSILGNYDQKVLRFAAEKIHWKKDKEADKYFSFEWTNKHLLWWHKRYLKTLPEKLEIERQGFCFLLVHGSPLSIEEGLGEDTSYERFLELGALVKADVVLCGHSHSFFDKKISGVRFINPGSVGRSFDKDPRASYVLLDINSGLLRTEHHRVDYPREKNLVKMKKEKFPLSLIDSIRLGQSLDTLKKEKLQKEEEKILKEVFTLAESCHYDKAHTQQVCNLSLMIFDQLKDFHRFSARERFLLRCGALLHDIGWISGGNRHHKASRDLIVQSKNLSLSDNEKTIVALLARYHRRSLPAPGHKLYGTLNAEDKDVVNQLAAILRIADGLDATHRTLVEDIKCVIDEQRLKIDIVSKESIDEEIESCREKADFFKEFFGKEVIIKSKTKEII
jgi:putative phosphoesterase